MNLSFASVFILLIATALIPSVHGRTPLWPPNVPDPDVFRTFQVKSLTVGESSSSSSSSSSSTSSFLSLPLPIYNITDFGAIGDNVTLNTVAIQNAIHTAYANGGGLVRVPPSDGTTIIAFKTATLSLLSNVYLYLPTGSVLHGSANQSDYVAVSGGNWDHWDVLHTINATNTGIIGDYVPSVVPIVGAPSTSGTLSGPMWQMISSYNPSENQLEPVRWINDNYNCSGECRPRLVVFEDCTNVVLSNIRLVDSADWTSLFRRVTGLTWENVTVWGSQQWPNNDGCDLESVTNAYWNNVNIFTGDDSLCLASGNTNDMLHPWPEPATNYTPTSNVLIENTILSSYSSAFKLEAIFQPYHGDIVNVTVRNTQIHASNRGIGMQQRTGKGIFQNVTFENLTIEARSVTGDTWWGAGEAVWLTSVPENYDQQNTGIGGIHGILFRNVSSVSEQGIIVISRDQGNVTMNTTGSITGLQFYDTTVIISVIGNATQNVHDIRPIDPDSNEKQQMIPANISGYYFEHTGGVYDANWDNFVRIEGGGVYFVGAKPWSYWVTGTCNASTPDSLIVWSNDVDCQPAVARTGAGDNIESVPLPSIPTSESDPQGSVSFVPSLPPSPYFTLGTNLSSFLAHHDLVWSWSPSDNQTFIPSTWYTAAISGNGFIGISVRGFPSSSSPTTLPWLRMEVSRTDVWGDQNRQPVGWFEIRSAWNDSFVHNITMRQRLYQGDLLIQLSTSMGTCILQCFADASGHEIIACDVQCTNDETLQWLWYADLTGVGRQQLPENVKLPLPNTSYTATGTTQYVGQGNYTAAYVIVPSDNAYPRPYGIPSSVPPCSPRYAQRYQGVHHRTRSEYIPRSAVHKRHISRTSLYDSYVPWNYTEEMVGLCWQVSESGSRSSFISSVQNFTIFITVANAQRTSAPYASNTIAAASLSTAVQQGFTTVQTNNANWWENYWSLSFVSFDTDTDVEGLYYTNMYRFAAGGRTAMHDLLGIVGPGGIDLCLGPWCQYVWDMNVQVMVYAIHGSNRQSILGNPSFDMFASVTEGNTWYTNYGSNAGSGDNLLWMMKSVHRHSLHMRNGSYLLNVVYPALTVGLDQGGGNLANYQKDAKNVLHIPNCYSPEYTGACNGQQPYPVCTDCSYQIGIRRWALSLAIQIATLYDPSQPRLNEWRTILNNLAPFPIDDNGYRISIESGFDIPHRHYSHLLSGYDLLTSVDTLNNNVQNTSVLRAGLDRWWNLTCAPYQLNGTFMEQCRGFTQGGMALLSAVVNRTEACRGNLTSLVRSVITPNGMYGEEVYAGHPEEYAPVSESAFMVAGVIHESMLSTYLVPWKIIGMANESTYLAVRLWNGCAYPNASFYRLRGEGGIVVSSQRNGMSTLFVGIEFNGVDDPYGTVLTVLVQVPDWSTLPQAVPSNVLVTVAEGLPNTFTVSWNTTLTNSFVLFPPSSQQPPFTVTESIGANTSYWNTWGYTAVRGEPFHAVRKQKTVP